MATDAGLQIASVHPGSLAEASGLRAGDIVRTVNSHKVRDLIDFMFYDADEELKIEVERRGRRTTLAIKKAEGSVLGIEFKPFTIKTCRNNCIFCFVKQLPRGLRKTLYVKDEDFRMSFLYGNYLTLTNLSEEDRHRIVRQRLMPLFVSVHTTNRALRNRMLGNPRAPDVVKELQFLSSNKIRFNAQIVLCPGYNDGDELRRTLSDLYRFYPYLLSVAVVPVGLTIHRKHALNPVEKEDALRALDIIDSFRRRFIHRHGNPIVHGADELYLKAGRTFPPVRQYGERHQIGNGVGMIPLFLHESRRLKIPAALRGARKCLTFTGTAFYPFLRKWLEKLSEKERVTIDVLPVENHFFGSSVTVAGLLTGRDVIRAALDKIDGHELLLVPDVVLDGERRFLDDITVDNLEDALGIPARIVPASAEGLVNGLLEAA